MPKLLLFAPCQKALIDKTENLVSLIGIMHSIIVSPDASQSKEGVIPQNAQIPLQWAVATIWLQNSEDQEKVFEQRIEMIAPNDMKLEINIQTFQMTHRTYQIAVMVNGFPAGISGENRLILSLREVGINQEWQVLDEYPINIQHEVVKKTDD